MAELRQEKAQDEEEIKEFIPKSKEVSPVEVDVDAEANRSTLHSDNLDYSGKQVSSRWMSYGATSETVFLQGALLAVLVVRE